MGDGFPVCSGGGTVTPAVVVQALVATETIAGTTLIFTGVTTAGGNLNMVAVGIRGGGIIPSSVIDSAGNTYALLFFINNTSTACLAVYATNQANPVALAAGVVTITVSGAIITVGRFWEISAANNTNPLDTFIGANSSGTASAAPSSGTSSNFANAGELIFGAIANDYGSTARTYTAFTFSAGAPTTSWPTATTGDNSAGTASAGLQLHSGAIVGASAAGQAISETISSASQWAAACWAIRSAGN